MRLVHVQAPLALATITALLAQQAPPPVQNPPVTFKSATHLVQVSVIAQDGKGQPVSDLRKEDFRVRVNGKDQSVKVFSMDSNLALPSSDPQKSDDLLPNVFSNRSAVAPGQKSSTTIILFDARNTAWADQAYAKAQVIRYLRTLHPGDHIGLYLLGKKALRVLHDYTADSTSLLKHLEALKYKELPNLSLKEPDATAALRHDSALLDALLNDSPTAEPIDQMANKIRGTLKAIEFIANHLAQTPGRKNLIWVSGGFPLMLDDGWKLVTFVPEMNETVRAINDANMAIYPVDARGLISDHSYDATSGGPPPLDSGLSRPIGVANQEPMQELASRTGGRAYINTNGLTKAIHDAIDDSLVTYTLGFYPVDDTFDGKFHKIEVDLVDRKDVHLRYRKGFIDLPPLAQDEKTRKRELKEAAWSPLDATGIGLTAKVVLSKTKPGALDVVLAIDTTQLSLENQSENWVGRLDVLFVQGDENGKLYSGFDDTIDIRLNSAEYAKSLKDGLVYTRLVEPPDRILLAHAISAGAASAQHLRIVVRDAATGALGSITVPLAKISKDLPAETSAEKTLESRVPKGNMAATMLAPYFFIGKNMARVNVAIEIPSASLKFEKEKGKLRSTMNILGIAYKEDGSVGARFSDAVKLDFETQMEVEAFQQKPYHYENRLDLGSGKYNLKVIITADGENFSELEQPLVLDAYDPKMFSVSPLALSTRFNKIVQVDQKPEISPTPLIANGFQVIPAGSAKFKKTDKAAMYFEIYEPALMEAEVPKLELAIQVRVFDAKGALKSESGGALPVPEKSGNPAIPCAGMIPVAKLEPGAYKVEVNAVDNANHAFTRTANFEVQ